MNKCFCTYHVSWMPLNITGHHRQAKCYPEELPFDVRWKDKSSGQLVPNVV